jgi:hypothetical protein
LNWLSTMKKLLSSFYSSQIRYRLWQLTVLLLILGFVNPATSTSAQEVAYEGLDIVFIIDQSGSMQRADGSFIPNDPLGLRFYAPWYAMYWMGESRLLIHQNITFRMSIVNFGTDAEIWDFGNGRYWQEIAPDSRPLWEPAYNELTNQIEGEMRERFTQESLGATNFLSPFEAAQTLFDDLPEPPGQRRRVVIVLTDGQPSGPIGGPSISVGQHMTSLRQFANANFREPDYRVYVVAMIDAGESYWDNVESYWDDITNDPCTRASCPDPTLNRAGIVSSNDEVGKRFQEILQDLVRDFPHPPGLIVVESAVIPGPLVVPPFLKSLDFTFFKSSPAERLILTDSNGNEMSITQPNVTIQGADGPIEAIRITNPIPGEWLVATNPPNTDVDITMRQIFATSKLDSPTGPQVQFLPVNIQYTLLNDLGQNLPFYSDSRYRLLVQATVEAGGQSWPVQLTGDPQNYVYQAEFTPIFDVPHTILVRAESQDLNGNPIVVFDDEIGRFNVGPVVLAPLSLPTAVQQYDTTSFQFELQDTRGFPVSSSAPINVAVTIGDQPDVPLNLTLQPDGTYEASYTLQQSGTYTMAVRSTVSDRDGNLFEIANEDLGEFEVIPTIRLGLNVMEPVEIEQWDTQLWPLNRNPFVLAVEVRDEDDNAVDLSRVFRNPAQALRVTLTDDKGESLSDLLVLTPTAQAGLYRAETTEIGRGQYNLRVEAVGELQTGYLYDERNKTQTLNLARIRHPLHIPILLGALLTLLIVTSGSYLAMRRYRSITKHPCTGRLYLVDSASVPLWQHGLDNFNRNHIVLKSGFNPLTRVTKIEALCQSEADNQAGRVQVKVWIDKDRTPIVDRSLGPKSEVKLGKLGFWLLKDPTEEQLSRDRFSGSDPSILNDF